MFLAVYMTINPLTLEYWILMAISFLNAVYGRTPTWLESHDYSLGCLLSILWLIFVSFMLLMVWWTKNKDISSCLMGTMHLVPCGSSGCCYLYLVFNLIFLIFMFVFQCLLLFLHTVTPPHPPDFDVLFYIVCIPPLAALLIALWGCNRINLEFMMTTCVIYDETLWQQLEIIK